MLFITVTKTIVYRNVFCIKTDVVTLCFLKWSLSLLKESEPTNHTLPLYVGSVPLDG